MKREFQHSCFPIKFAKYLGAPILKNICERLLLKKRKAPSPKEKNKKIY